MTKTKAPKPRKKQKFPEFWYRPDVDVIHFVPLPPYLPMFLSAYSIKHFGVDSYMNWQSVYFDSTVFRLKGKRREGWGKFEFICEVKP